MLSLSIMLQQIKSCALIIYYVTVYMELFFHYLLCYIPMELCSHYLLCYIAMELCSHYLLCYIPMELCSHYLLRYIDMELCSHYLLCYCYFRTSTDIMLDNNDVMLKVKVNIITDLELLGWVFNMSNSVGPICNSYVTR